MEKLNIFCTRILAVQCSGASKLTTLVSELQYYWHIFKNYYGILDNLCAGGKYPLVSLAYRRLVNLTSVTTTTVKSSSSSSSKSASIMTTSTTAKTTTTTTTTVSPFKCSSASEIFVNPKNCDFFYSCSKRTPTP
jgi:hypothetical protein